MGGPGRRAQKSGKKKHARESRRAEGGQEKREKKRRAPRPDPRGSPRAPVLPRPATPSVSSRLKRDVHGYNEHTCSLLGEAGAVEGGWKAGPAGRQGRRDPEGSRRSRSGASLLVPRARTFLSSTPRPPAPGHAPNPARRHTQDRSHHVPYSSQFLGAARGTGRPPREGGGARGFPDSNSQKEESDLSLKRAAKKNAEKEEKERGEAVTWVVTGSPLRRAQSCSGYSSFFAQSTQSTVSEG